MTTLAEQVRRELERVGDPRLIAAVNSERGTVTTVLAPKPYWSENESEAEAVELDALRAVRDSLRAVVDRPTTPEIERMRAQSRIDEIEKLLNEERLKRQPFLRREVHATMARPDWEGVSESARGLIAMIACAALRGEDTGEEFNVLPRALRDDPEIATSWRSHPAWKQWIAAPPETRRAYVSSAIADLRRAKP